MAGNPDHTESYVSLVAGELRRLDTQDRNSALRKIVPTLDLAQRFELLDALGVYHHCDTMSGIGSTLEETTALRTALPALLRNFSVRSLLDVPCGDFNWLQHVPLEHIDYIGADIVARIVEENNRLYASRKRYFLRLDATKDRLPKVDLILCRDLLIHLSLDDISDVLDRFAASGAQWLFATHFSAVERNSDILSGDFRPVNLCLPPFRLPEPDVIVSERSRMENGVDRAMALWPVSAIR